MLVWRWESIFPFFFFFSFDLCRVRQQSKQRHPDFPLLAHFLQLLWGETFGAIPGQPMKFSPACPGHLWGLHPVGHVWQTSPGRHPDQMPKPPQKFLPMWRSSGSTPSSLRVTELSGSAMGTLISAAWIQYLFYLDRDPELMTTDTCWNKDRPVNHLHLHHDGWVQRPHDSRRPTDARFELEKSERVQSNDRFWIALFEYYIHARLLTCTWNNVTKHVVCQSIDDNRFHYLSIMGWCRSFRITKLSLVITRNLRKLSLFKKMKERKKQQLL